MLGDILQSEVRSLIEAKDFATLKSAVSEMELHDLTELLSELKDEDLAVVFRLLHHDQAAEIFGDLEIEQQEDLIKSLSSEKVANILNDMPPDERTELLEELPGRMSQRLLSSLRGDELKIARSLLAYPEDSIGRLMTPEYLAVREDWTVDMVFRHIRKRAAGAETVNVIYVVDEQWKLQDELRLDQLVLAEPEQEVSEIMDRQVAYLTAGEDQEEAVEVFRKYDSVALPVVNRHGVLVGIVTIDDVMDVAEEESTEDIQKMVGVSPLEYSYFGTGFLAMIKKRLPWLALLLVVETLAVIVLDGYHQMLAVLAMFMPLINATAGNTGNQVSGLMIRGLAVQEVDLNDWGRILVRELLWGLVMGALLAIVAYAIVISFGRDMPIALSVSIAMLVAVTLANVLGSMLPFIFKRIGVDPAVTSGPFIACLMDVSAILIYFSVAVSIIELTKG